MFWFFHLQVSQMGVRLLQGVEQVQHIPLDLGSPIVHASSADPHVVILSEDGQVILLTLRESRGQGRLSVTRPTLSVVSKEVLSGPSNVTLTHCCISEV